MLDGLRICAASLVMLYHFTAYESHGLAWNRPLVEVFPRLWHVTAYGALGVQLFFIISGFVILMSSWGRTLPQFVASRISRLYPAYWVALALTALLLMVIWKGAVHRTAGEALVNLTMFQSVFGVNHLDGVYWTLWIELCFYILISLFTLVGITPNRVLAFAGLWPIAAAFAGRADSKLLTMLLQPQYASLFAGGMLIYLVCREGHSVLAWLLVGMNVVLSVHVTTNGMFRTIEKRTHHDLPNATCAVVIVAFFALIALVTLTPLRHISWRWLTWAGVLTYPLYLTHQYWGLWTIHLMHPHASTWSTLITAIAAVFVLAWAIHLVAERPFHQRFRRAIERSFVTTAAETGPAR